MTKSFQRILFGWVRKNFFLKCDYSMFFSLKFNRNLCYKKLERKFMLNWCHFMYVFNSVTSDGEVNKVKNTSTGVCLHFQSEILKIFKVFTNTFLALYRNFCIYLLFYLFNIFSILGIFCNNNWATFYHFQLETFFTSLYKYLSNFTICYCSILNCKRIRSIQ